MKLKKLLLVLVLAVMLVLPGVDAFAQSTIAVLDSATVTILDRAEPNQSTMVILDGLE